MAKRKRAAFEDDGPAGNSTEERSIKLQLRRLEQQIEYGQKTLHRALKLARGFERQKLGRRQKTAQTNNDRDGMARLSQEVRTLKVWAPLAR